MANDVNKEQWFSNKDLYEMVIQLQLNMSKLNNELKTTQEIVEKYNNLRGRLETTEQKVDQWETRLSTQLQIGKAVRDWGGWVVAIITATIALAGFFLNK